MTLSELQEKLDALGMPEGYFSQNELTDGIHVAYYDYNSKWRVYRHERDNYDIDVTFLHVEDAYDYVYEKAKQEAKYYNRKNS